jgi:hypothetical protein
MTSGNRMPGDPCLWALADAEHEARHVPTRMSAYLVTPRLESPLTWESLVSVMYVSVLRHDTLTYLLGGMSPGPFE